MSTKSRVRRSLAFSAILFGIASCSTAPSLAPQACLERCRVNTCLLSQYYVGKDDDEARVAEELNCIEVNASQARDCAKLKDVCAAALEKN